MNFSEVWSCNPCSWHCCEYLIFPSCAWCWTRLRRKVSWYRIHWCFWYWRYRWSTSEVDAPPTEL